MGPNSDCPGRGPGGGLRARCVFFCLIGGLLNGFFARGVNGFFARRREGERRCFRNGRFVVRGREMARACTYSYHTYLSAISWGLGGNRRLIQYGAREEWLARLEMDGCSHVRWHASHTQRVSTFLSRGTTLIAPSRGSRAESVRTGYGTQHKWGKLGVHHDGPGPTT